MKPTLLQVLRGEVTRDQLEPDSPPCHETDMLTSLEVAKLRVCSDNTVHNARRKGLLRGTPAEPYRFFGWSVLQFIGWLPPEPPVEKPTTPVPPPPRPRPSPRPSEPIRAVQGLRHLRLPGNKPSTG